MSKFRVLNAIETIVQDQFCLNSIHELGTGREGSVFIIQNTEDLQDFMSTVTVFDGLIIYFFKH